MLIIGPKYIMFVGEFLVLSSLTIRTLYKMLNIYVCISKGTYENGTLFFKNLLGM